MRTRQSTRSLVALLALALVLPGCESLFGPGSPADPAPPEPIDRLPRELTGPELEAIRASNAFGLDLLREVRREAPGENAFLSPFSASMALGMTMNGADGATFDAMRSTLRFEGLSEAEINASYRGLLDLLVALDPAVEVAIGNAVWHRDHLVLRPEFRERVEASFDAMVRGLDFGDPASADTINRWVSESTSGRIDSMVDPPIPGQVVAYLMNAVYFKAGWTTPFDPKLTYRGPFRRPDGSTAEVDFMLRDDTLRFHSTEEWAAIDLPYGGGAWSMTAVVPRGERTVEELVEALDAEAWDALVDGFQTSRVLVSLPRFELEWEGVLNDPLTEMGMGPAFMAGADFTRMFEGIGPWISEVRQKSFVRVDEEGTEAAAVTSVVMVTSMPPEFRADRPFLFGLRERLSGTILFIGVITDPPAT